MQQSFADDIALAALHHYHHVLPSKGKPKENEWTVYAAIVAVSKPDPTKELPSNNNDDLSHDGTATAQLNTSNTIWIVSCATGTKCCAISSNTKTRCDHILRDSHAEVLARRGLVRVLWNEMIHTIQSKNQKKPSIFVSSNDSIYHKESCDGYKDSKRSCNLLLTECTDTASSDSGVDTVPKFLLRDDIELHMYISDAPCGDASIYEIKQTTTTTTDTSSDTTLCNDKDRNETSDRLQNKFTGSKAIVVDVPKIETTNDRSVQQQVHIIREADEQILGQLRTKSGRSYIDVHRRSSSMSCSDKLVRWSILGLQGAILSKYIPSPIRFTSIIVGHDPATSDIVSIHDSKQPPNVVALHSTQTMALQRAIPHRVQLVQQFLRELRDDDTTGSSIRSVEESALLQNYVDAISIPNVFTSKHTFSRGKAIVEYCTRSTASRTVPVIPQPGKRKRSDMTVTENDSMKRSVTGIAINWHSTESSLLPWNDNVELIVGVRGIRHGKKPKCNDDAQQLQSQLCRKALWTLHEDFLLLLRKGNDNTNESHRTIADKQEQDGNDYIQFKTKHVHSLYRVIRARMFSRGSPLAGWLVGDASDQHGTTHCY